MRSLYLGILITIVDQWTKVVVQSRIHLGEQIPVIENFFNLTYVQNPGAAFGIFSGFRIGLSLLSIVMLGLMIRFRRVFFTDSIWHRIAFGCLIGGIVGNFLDRVRLTYVVDFLDFYWRNHHFASFNVADSAICVGVCIYLVTSYLQPKDEGGVVSDRVDPVDSETPATPSE